ncbi:MAG: hypothetical protein JNK49_17935 [Planctomycetes bacterium]|nr:hypothetical protein [Planctomycetota bacterium]
MLPLRSFVASCFAVLLLGTSCAGPGGAPAPSPGAMADDPTTIHWQRSLEDALQLCAATGAPLLIAVNMDGESASDRIHRERYRDPAFVQWTRRCVCLPASVFRHNRRDHDAAGRRIPCPRFGGVTCGEHIALEPILYERYLQDGDRVAPRHALVRQDQQKAFDLSLSFDLRDIDQALAQHLAKAPVCEPLPAPSHRARLAAEDALANAGPTAWAAALARLAAGTAEPALGPEVLRRLVHQVATGPATQHAPFAAAARATGAVPALATALREALQEPLLPPADPASQLALLAALADPSPAQGWFELGTQALAGDGAFATRTLLAAAERTTAAATDPLPAPGAAPRLPMGRDEAEAQLSNLEGQLAAAGPAVWLQFAQSNLDFGRAESEAGRRNARLHFVDAAEWLDRALAQQPTVTAHVERARAAYWLEDFDGQVRAAAQGLALATALPSGTLPTDPSTLPAEAVEPLRWLGDGRVQQLGRVAAPTVEQGGSVAEALRALLLVAASPFGRARDWLAAASCCGGFGLWHDQVAILQCGLRRFPEDAALRDLLAATLWRTGQLDLLPALALGLLKAAPSGLAEWHVGAAYVWLAEDHRRAERHGGAVLAYSAAQRHFASAAQRDPQLAADCAQRLAGCWLGRGMALAHSGAQQDAAGCLLAAAAAEPQAAQTWRDGLDADALDLVDRVLEWREAGPSPVVPEVLAEQLAAAVPGAAFWLVAVADAAIREGLRADGRNPDRVLRETVDAGGQPVRMLLGRPCELGDGWLRAAWQVARRAVAVAPQDGEARQALAQAATLWAERQLERGREDGVEAALATAGEICGVARPSGVVESGLGAWAAQLRAALGPARPRLRAGR